jgi:hypothetical protein
MEIPMMMGQQNQSIEEQYAQGPPPATDMAIPAPQMTKEQWDTQHAEQLKQMTAELPDLRIVSEYNRLMVEGKELGNRQMEAMVMSGEVSVNTLPESPLKNELIVRINKAGVMSGKMPLQNEQGQLVVPGLLGTELVVSQTQALQYLLQQKSQLDNAVKENQRKENDLKAASLQTGISTSLQYTGDNAGQIQAFVRGTSIEDAPVLQLDADNTDKRISISVPDESSRSGSRQLVMLPTDRIVKCTDDSIWSMTVSEYNDLTPISKEQAAN